MTESSREVPNPEPTITDRHYMLFGRIVSNYARVEVGIRCVFAALLEMPIEIALIVTASYSNQALRNVTRSLAKIVMHEEPELLNRFTNIIGGHKSLDRLRNDIAHNMWSRGSTPDHISTMTVTVADGKAKFVGYESAAKRQYSREELRLAANLAVQLNHDIIAYIDDPLFTRFIADKSPLVALDIDEILKSSAVASLTKGAAES
jgi:hypothetical protein